MLGVRQICFTDSTDFIFIYYCSTSTRVYGFYIVLRLLPRVVCDCVFPYFDGREKNGPSQGQLHFTSEPSDSFTDSTDFIFIYCCSTSTVATVYFTSTT